MAQLHQRVEGLRHGSLAAQQPQDYDSGAGSGLQKLFVAIGSFQGNGIVGPHLRKALGGHPAHRPLCGEDVGIGGGDQEDVLPAGFLFSRQIFLVVCSSPGPD